MLNNHKHGRPQWPSWRSYLLGGILFAIAFSIRLLILPVEDGIGYVTLFPAVALTALLCGVGPTLVFVVLSAMAVAYVFVPPHWDIPSWRDAIRGTALFVSGSLVILLGVEYSFRRLGQQKREMQEQMARYQQAAAALAKSEARMAGIVESAMDAIISVDAKLQVVVFNPAAERMLGYRAEDVLGSGLERFIPERFSHTHASKVRSFGETGVSGRGMNALGELYAMRSDGSEFPIEASISHVTVNGETIFTIIMRDITERALARQTLAEHEERFRAFMSHSPLASWIVDGDGRFQYVSPHYYAMFGVTAENLVGKRIKDLYPDPLAERYLRNNQFVIESGQTLETIEAGLRADGSPGEFLVIKFVIHSAAGEPLICGVALDITERRRIETQLIAANARLAAVAAEQASHLRALSAELTRAEQNERDHLAEILHDHVQPLLVAVRLALFGLDRNTPSETWERVAIEARKHISTVIDMARSLSVELNPPLVREQGLCAALEWLGQRVSSTHGINVIVACDHDAEPEDVETRLLCFKAVRELLMNAVKYAEVDRVDVEMMVDEEDVLTIRVADRGKGFDPHSMFRSVANRAGSGLSSIERRLGMIGGRLLIDSTPGEGTTMTLLVPLQRRRKNVFADAVVSTDA